MSQDLYQVNLTIPYGTAVGTQNALLMAIPGTSWGGGITLRNVWFCANKDIGAGSAPVLRIITRGATGTIGTIVSNGSAALTMGTAIAGTISSAFVAGTVSFLSLQYGHEVNGSPDFALTTVVTYSMGRGSA